MCLWCCWKDLDEQDLMDLILVKIWNMVTTLGPKGTGHTSIY